MAPSSVVDTMLRSLSSLSAGEQREREREHAFDSASYEALKQRVHLLKREQQGVVKSKAAAHELESAALVQQRRQHEAATLALQDEVAALQAQLRANTERSAKMRLHMDKDKKAAQVQAEKLGKALEGRDAEHERRVEQLRTEHRVEVERLEGQLEEVSQGREEDRRAFERARDAAVAEASEWCEGEIEAVRHTLGKQLEASRTEERRRQEECEGLEQQAQHRQVALEECRQQAQQLEGRLEAAQQQLEEQGRQAQQQKRELEEERARRVEDASRAEAAHKAEVDALKSTHLQQLELVGQRLEHVVSRKDATIAALRAELQRVHDKLRMFEGLLGAGPGPQRPAGQGGAGVG